MSFLIGSLGDNLSVLFLSYIYRTYGGGYVRAVNYPFGVNFPRYNSSEPIFQLGIEVLARFYNSILVYDLLVLCGLVLTLIVGYLFFRRLHFARGVALVCVSLFVFSPYFYYHIQEHADLVQVWALLLPITVLISTPKSYGRFIAAGLLLALCALISNYLAFIGLLFFLVYFIVLQVTAVVQKSFVWRHLVGPICFYVSFGLGVLPFLFPFVRATYLNGNGLARSVSQNMVVVRSLEDFFVFSSRPWYYFLPSVDNPFIGRLSSAVLYWLTHSWRYWLTFGYFKSEHSASYLGYLNMVMAIAGLVAVTKAGACAKQKKVIWPLGITALVMAIVTMPPYFTVDLHKVYLPSYFIWRLFPMFRSLARVGILVLLIELVFVGMGYEFLVNGILRYLRRCTSKVAVSVMATVVFLLFIASAMEFFIPIKIARVSTPPAVFSFIKETTPSTSAIAVFPYGKLSDALFWMDAYDRALVNPRGVVRPKNEFNSEEFTSQLPTPAGLEKARKLGTDYIVYFNKADIKQDENTAFFDSSPLMKRVYTFDAVSKNARSNPWSRFIVITDLGHQESDSAILYEVN